MLGVGLLGEMGVQIADDWLLAGDDFAGGDEHGNRLMAGCTDELGTAVPLDRHLANEVGEAEFG